MQCKYHPDRTAQFLCATCKAPLCSECAEEVEPGHYLCFQCAMIQSVSAVGTSIKQRREQEEKSRKKRKRWGPFRYFLIVSSVLIGVMWGVILFGGREPPPRMASVDLARKGRVLLFMVDGAIKRYAHYEGDKYPEKLTDLVPKYLSLRDNEIFYLKKLTYERNTAAGYRLSLVSNKPGEMDITLTPKGVEATLPSEEVPK